jgi:hypothetical protein
VPTLLFLTIGLIRHKKEKTGWDQSNSSFDFIFRNNVIGLIKRIAPDAIGN